MRIINVERKVRLHIEPTKLQVMDVMKFPDGDWKVLDVVGDKALIWKYTNVKDHVFNENNKNTYKGSDIQKYLRNDFKKTVPMDILERVTDEGFFLLSLDQVKQYMPVPPDRTAVDPEGYNTWRLTSSPSVGSGSGVRSISPTGCVSIRNASTSHGVAPACWISL